MPRPLTAPSPPLLDYPTSSSSQTRPHYGTVIYSREPLSSDPQHYSSSGMEITLLSVNWPCCVAVVYKSPQRQWHEFKHFLCSTLSKRDTTLPLIVVGDFNINLDATSHTSSLETTMNQQFSCKQVIENVTTDNKTRIDHIFTEVPSDQYEPGVLESYYSDHKPVFISLSK